MTKKNVFTQHFNIRQTPQNEPIIGSGQVPNSAGGYAWAVDDWSRLARFLILGSEGGTYYISEQKLTVDNAKAVLRCLAADGLRTVETIVAVSDSGRAPKNDPAIFALALAASLGDEATKRAALAALPQVCRIGTHLFHFASYIETMRGWGRGLRGAVAKWYQQDATKLGLQVVKYQQREGWSHRDLLRLAHPHAPSEQHNTIYNWVVKQGWEAVGDEPHPDAALRLLWAFEKAKRATQVEEVVRLIREFELPREAIPTQWLNEVAVWEALLGEGTMPMTALIRNLATMTRTGLLARHNKATARVIAALEDQKRLRQARIHPIAILAAMTTYASGKGIRGSGTWEPITEIVNALDAAFYASFGNVTPTNKRWLLALDVSGSMAVGAVAGVPGLTPRIGSAAMALITAATEKQHYFVGFSAPKGGGGYGGKWGGGTPGLTPLDITPRQRLDDVVKKIEAIPMGGTDCALPMLYATQNKLEVDAFVVYTDSETWHGGIHPVQALRQYREKMGIPAKLIVVAMVANDFTIADPNDAGMLDVVGFDTATPQVMSEFVSGM